MAPRKVHDKVKLIAKEMYESNDPSIANPLNIVETLTAPPYNAKVSLRSIQRWAKEGNWDYWKISLSELPKSEQTNPDEETMRHLAIGFVKKAHRAKQGDPNPIPHIVTALIAEWNPPKRVVAYIRDVFLPSWIASDREWEYFDYEVYTEQYNLASDPSAGLALAESPDFESPASILELENRQILLQAKLAELVGEFKEISKQIRQLKEGESE